MQVTKAIVDKKCREFGKRLYAARMALGLSQRAMGRRCCVSPSLISLIENSERTPVYRTLISLQFGTIDEETGISPLA